MHTPKEKVYPLSSMNVNLFGKRFLEEACKDFEMKSSITVSPKSNEECLYERAGEEPQRGNVKLRHRDGPRTASRYTLGGKDQSFLQSVQKNESCQHLDFRPLASRTVREWVSVGLKEKFGQAHSLRKFPDQGLNPHCSSNLGQSSGNTRSLAWWATRELLNFCCFKLPSWQ